MPTTFEATAAPAFPDDAGAPVWSERRTLPIAALYGVPAVFIGVGAIAVPNRLVGLLLGVVALAVVALGVRARRRGLIETFALSERFLTVVQPGGGRVAVPLSTIDRVTFAGDRVRVDASVGTLTLRLRAPAAGADPGAGAARAGRGDRARPDGVLPLDLKRPRTRRAVRAPRRHRGRHQGGSPRRRYGAGAPRAARRGSDAELAVDVAQVVLDGLRAEEQRRGGLARRPAARPAARDLQLLRRQVGRASPASRRRAVSPVARSSARGPVGPRRGAERARTSPAPPAACSRASARRRARRSRAP